MCPHGVWRNRRFGHDKCSFFDTPAPTPPAPVHRHWIDTRGRTFGEDIDYDLAQGIWDRGLAWARDAESQYFELTTMEMVEVLFPMLQRHQQKNAAVRAARV